MIRLCLSAFAFGAGVSLLSAQQPKSVEPSVRVSHVAVQAAEPADRDTPARPGSLTVHLRITLPEKEIVGFDSAASKLAAFTDAKGTDLTGGAGHVLLESVYVQPAKDHSRCTARFITFVKPAAKAREFHLKADLQVLLGVGVQTNQETIAVTPGIEKAVGPVKVRAGGTRQTPTVTLTYTQELFKDVEFEDAAGKAVKLAPTSGSGTRDKENNRLLWRQEYRPPQPLDKLTVRVRTYEKVDTTSVPVDLTFGLGLE